MGERLQLRRAVLLAMAVTATTGLAGCAADATSAASGSTGDSGAAVAVGEVAPQPADAGRLPDRKVSRTATVDLVVQDVAAAAGALRSIAAVAGGTVTAEVLRLPAGSAPSTAHVQPSGSLMVLSVPATALEATLERIADVGELTDRTVESVDVTDEVVDTDARVNTMRASIARLTELMDRAGSVSEIAQVESELTSRQAELESLLGRQKALAAMVELSPVTVNLTARTDAPAASPDGFVAGFLAGLEALRNLAGGALTVVGAVLPFAGVVALLVAPLLWWRARAHRSQAPARQEAAAKQEAPAQQEAAGAAGEQPDQPEA